MQPHAGEMPTARKMSDAPLRNAKGQESAGLASASQEGVFTLACPPKERLHGRKCSNCPSAQAGDRTPR